MPFDPAAALPGAPDPWTVSEMPAWRDGPPYAMTEMIATEPAVARRLVQRLRSDPALGRVAAAVVDASGEGRPVTITGCGTSQHGAIAVAALLANGLATTGQRGEVVRAVQAFELAGRVPHPGVVIGISHEGGTEATNLALQWAGGRDGMTALVTVSDRSPGAALAHEVLTTGEQDQSWCHTVGYLSPLVAGACLHAAVTSTELSGEAVERQIAAGADDAVAERLAAGLAATDHVVVVGSGADYAAARELALKIEEGARLPAVAHELETIRHGHLAAATERTGLVVLLTDAEASTAPLRNRARSVFRAGAALGMPSVLIGSSDMAGVGSDASVGAYLVGLDDDLPRIVAGVLAVVLPLQLLTERLARARGTNPDAIAREDPRQAAAASA